MLLAFITIVIIIVCLVAGAIARRIIPKTYATINAIAWSIGGLFIAVALARLH
jgi:uncharacterized membrane protein YeaQ/YmgE (transglycosylase-associated protein family)